eukprot:Skav201523  [mRNA]  locus=scaffold4878:48558:50270:+ [translate_table: standard]
MSTCQEGDPYYAMPAWATRFIGPNEMKLLDAVVHVVEGAGPGRLDVKPEMKQGRAGGRSLATQLSWHAHLRVPSRAGQQGQHHITFGGAWSLRSCWRSWEKLRVALLGVGKASHSDSYIPGLSLEGPCLELHVRCLSLVSLVSATYCGSSSLVFNSSTGAWHEQ